MTVVSAEDVRAAAERIRPIAHRTPVLTNRSFDDQFGGNAYFKCENLQRGGAFKIRGAANFLYSLPEADRARGVVAYSSGNHAQAVAIAARSLGVKATLIMPSDAPRSKLEATRSHGPTVITYDRHRESREAIGRHIAQDTGATLVPPFDHPWIVAGQGTCGRELMEEAPDLDAVVVCLGGGGLLAGCAVAARAASRSVRLFGVEPEIANDWWLSRRAGHPVEIGTPETIADGLRAPRPGAVTFPIVQELVEDILLVTEQEIKDTVKYLMSRLKLVVEPSGAVAAAAVLYQRLPAGLRKAGIVISGGNVDLEVLASL
jgi:threonine dehydratase